MNTDIESNMDLKQSVLDLKAKLHPSLTVSFKKYSAENRCTANNLLSRKGGLALLPALHPTCQYSAPYYKQ